MAAQPDFWGEIGSAEVVRTPVLILREQAALLGKKTKGLVEATVDTDASGGSFIHRFKLVVPALDNYTYELFSISNGIDFYPMEAHGFQNRSKFGSMVTMSTLRSEDEFLHWLQEILSSPETKKIIANILAQATG